jgi:hypothetical protein
LVMLLRYADLGRQFHSFGFRHLHGKSSKIKKRARASVIRAE